jgi:hypothetical protein
VAEVAHVRSEFLHLLWLLGRRGEGGHSYLLNKIEQFFFAIPQRLDGLV